MWRAPEGPEGTGGLRDRPLRAAGSRAAISRAAGPDGARNTSVTTSKHAAAPPERRTRPGCWWAAAKPGRASRRRAQPPISHHAPLLWRAPEGPEGTGGLRDRPLRAKLACGDLAGGRARRRPQHQRHHKQHAQEGRRPPAHTAAGPDGAQNTSVTTSNTHRKAAAHRHTQRFSPQNKTRGSPSGPPRVHATSSYSTPSRGRAFSAVAQPRPRRPGPR